MASLGRRAAARGGAAACLAACPRLALAVPGEPALVVALLRRRPGGPRPEHVQLPGLHAQCDDEGIYAAQAWAVLRLGRLAPYTYFYDHAPAGWILIAAWMGLTGGPHAFGSADRQRPGADAAAAPGDGPPALPPGPQAGLRRPRRPCWRSCLFSLSPLAIFYQRLLLLDNIMLFWVLLSLDLLLDGWGRLCRIVLSGSASASRS